MVIGRTRRTQNTILMEMIMLRALQSGSADSHLRFNMEAIMSSRCASRRIIRISLKNILLDMACINLFIDVNLTNGLLFSVVLRHHKSGNTRSLIEY